MQQVVASQHPPTYPAALFPARLEWLCQPKQIEYTLLLLYFLNFWKRACQQLLYIDRQGLGEIQAFILEHATKMGMVQATAYLDGTHRFPSELLLDSAAENAARGVHIHLKGVNDPLIWPPSPPEGDRTYQHYIRPLYKHITGRNFKLVEEAVNALAKAQIRAYIQEHLHELVERAKTTRQPIPTSLLEALCIAPVDLLHIRDNRLCFLDGYESWGELDISDQRKLDPEGYSEIAFCYTSPSAEFVFHLPFRRAEPFVPAQRLRALQASPGSSQELGIYQGKPIGQEESLRHPAKEILQDLGATISDVCPHELLDKESFLAKPAIRDILWPTRYREHEDWDNDPWDCICLPPSMI